MDGPSLTPVDESSNGRVESNSNFIPTQPSESEGMILDGSGSPNLGLAAAGPTITPWLLRGPLASSLISGLASLPVEKHSLAAHQRIQDLRLKRGIDSIVSSSMTDSLSDPGSLLRGALVSVNLQIIGRGCPEDFAIIYRPSEQALSQLSNRVSTEESVSSVV